MNINSLLNNIYIILLEKKVFYESIFSIKPFQFSKGFFMVSIDFKPSNICKGFSRVTFR